MLEIKHFRSSVMWTQLGYFRFAFVPKPTANPAERIAGGKEEQGSGRMTFFCSAGIKERRSKADFAPTWRGRRDLNSGHLLFAGPIMFQSFLICPDFYGNRV
ncbi:MAG: hypothetical protein ACI4O6_09705 [Dysosmobacter sp.]